MNVPVWVGAASAAVLAVAVVAAAAVAWRLRRGYVVVTVDGESMAPAFAPRDRVLVRRGRDGVERGAVVVVGLPSAESGWRGSAPLGPDVPGEGWYIKRVAATAGERYPDAVGLDGNVPPAHVALLGDNIGSIDSRHHGPCPEHQILGVVVRRMSRSPREDARGAGAARP
ncbi:S24/S26 family peptidase [Nocardiopsis sp. NPDC050513]|uniref:S24/S26 family peptidase n=1 Tax=Nocardiopsis sp. NPDC050513 TaxID=3364338 RepID=UPI0037AA71F1